MIRDDDIGQWLAGANDTLKTVVIPAVSDDAYLKEQVVAVYVLIRQVQRWLADQDGPTPRDRHYADRLRAGVAQASSSLNEGAPDAESTREFEQLAAAARARGPEDGLSDQLLDTLDACIKHLWGAKPNLPEPTFAAARSALREAWEYGVERDGGLDDALGTRRAVIRSSELECRGNCPKDSFQTADGEGTGHS